ncbi:MAG: O-antigen ligase family protein [Candidatus Omnitrophota bacterium]
MQRHKLAQIFDKIAVISLHCFIFTLPFSKSLVEIFFGIAFLAWFFKKVLLRSLKFAYTELNVPILGFLSAAFISMLTSVSLSLSLEGFFFKFLEWILIFFIAVETLSDGKRIKRIFITMTTAMLLISCDGIFQKIKGFDFLRHFFVEGTGVQASFNNPNDFAGWLLVMIFMAFSLAYFLKGDIFLEKYRIKKSAAKTVFLVITGLLLIALFFTCSMGAWIAFVVSFIFLGIMKSKKLLLFSLALFLILPVILPGLVKQRLVSMIKLEDTSTVARVILWAEAVNIIKDYPVFGTGPNTYTEVVSAYKTSEGTGVYPHNSYLRLTVETGIAGIVSFLWIIIVLFLSLWETVKKIASDNIYGILLTGLLAGTLAFLIHCAVDTNLHSLQLGALIWFVFGLMFAVKKAAENTLDAVNGNS